MNQTYTVYSQALFAVAAIWNLSAAAMLLFHPDFLLGRLGIKDAAARLLARSFASSVTTWGIAYALIAFDQERFRDFAWLGVISKTIFFLIYFVALLNRQLSFAAFVPALVDLVFALLFLEFLWHTKGR
ncbi:MAG: hypothetical protein ABIU20_09745 [Blastocatellia bacterium]